MVMRRVTFALSLLFSGTVFATTVNFSGFWKENCDEPYGLQIKAVGSRYMVTFCGPGGCGEPNAASATPIEGDETYEILAPDKIRIRYAEEYAPVYTKCTTETNPHLEYSPADQAEERSNLIFSIGIHLGYLVVAILSYIFLYKRLGNLAPMRRLALRSGIAALLFTPGIYFTWPIANPTFAFFALVFSLPALVRGVGGIYYFILQASYSIGAILLVWAVLFILGWIYGNFSKTDPGRP